MSGAFSMENLQQEVKLKKASPTHNSEQFMRMQYKQESYIYTNPLQSSFQQEIRTEKHFSYGKPWILYWFSRY